MTGIDNPAGINVFTQRCLFAAVGIHGSRSRIGRVLPRMRTARLFISITEMTTRSTSSQCDYPEALTTVSPRDLRKLRPEGAQKLSRM